MARSPQTVNPAIPTGGVEIARRAPGDPRRGRPAAVLGGGRVAGGLRGAAADLPLPRHPPPAPPAGPRDAQPGGVGDAPRAGGRRLPRGRDARADPLDARGRARLPGAQPDAARLLVRPAAEPAAVQAAADGGRPRALLPDRPLLPGRGPARRPPARVHPARRRGLLRGAGRGAGADRARPGGLLRGRGRRGDRPLPAHHPHRRGAALRHRPAGHALRHGDPRLDRARRRVGLRRLRGGDRGRGRGARPGRARRGRRGQPARRRRADGGGARAGRQGAGLGRRRGGRHACARRSRASSAPSPPTSVPGRAT